jgi:signal transduction histidine kinase
VHEETEDLKKRYKQLEILYRISLQVSSDTDLDNILSSVINGVQEGLGFDRVGIFQVEEDEELIRGRIGVDRSGKKENIENQIFSMKVDDNNFAKIALGKIDMYFTEDADANLPESHRKYMQPGIGQNLVVPLRSRGKVIGMIAVDNVISKKRISRDDINLLITFAEQAAIAIQNARNLGKEREASARLRKLEETKSSFLSKMSHELRTPLASIKESLNLMLKNFLGDINENQTKFLNIASVNVDRLSWLIDELLDSAKMEAKELKLEISPVDLYKLTEEVIYEIKPQADIKEINIELLMPQTLSPVHADKRRVSRVLTNYLSNALKNTKHSGKIKIYTIDSAECVIICVEDNGVGIDQAFLDKIFEKFYQIESQEASRNVGVGLGLAISKEIIEAHGGKVWAESDGPGTGAKFFFSLPKG